MTTLHLEDAQPKTDETPDARLSSRRRLLGDLAAVGFIVLCAIITWVSWNHHGERIEREVLAAREQMATLDVQHLQLHASQTLRHIDLSLKTLLDTGPAVNDPDWDVMLRNALRNSPQLRSLSLLNAQGDVIASSNAANIGTTPSRAGFLPDVPDDQELLRIGPPRAGRDLTDMAQIIGGADLPPLYFVPVLRSQQRPEGAITLMAAVNMEYFLNSGSVPTRAPNDHLEILSFSGLRLLDDNAVSTDSMLRANQELVAQWRQGSELGRIREDLGADGRYTAVYRVTHSYPLGVVARFNEDAALGAARAERHRQQARLLPAVAIGFTCALLGYAFFRSAGNRERAKRRRVEAALRESEARYRTTIDAVRDGMWEWDVQSGTLRWDDRCFELLGYPPQAFAIDFEHFRNLLHPDDAARVVTRLANQTSSADGFSNEFRLRTASGVWYWIESRGRVVEWKDGKPLRVVGTNTDIQARKTSEQRLRVLEAALNAAANAVVITNPKAQIEWVNPAFTALTGYAESEAIGRSPRELVYSGMHQAEFYVALWNTILAGDVWRGEIINRHRDGALYHEALTITPVRDEHGTLDHFVAIKEDVSARKAAEAKLTAAHAQLCAVVDNFPGAVVLESPDGAITLANDALCDLLGIPSSASELVGTRSADLVAAVSTRFASSEGFVERIQELRLQARTVFSEEIEMLDHRWLERDFVPVRSGDTLLGFLRIYRDVTERKQHEQTLRRLATIDPLTGCWNRAAFLERAESERFRHRRNGHPTALVMLDIDHFKRINDAWGHAAGDAVLRHFVQELQASLRATDTLGRLGGEEFALLLTDTDRNGAIELAERLRTRIATGRVPFGEQQIVITFSSGIAVLREDDPSVDVTLARADAALYRAKSGGRNRVECEPPDDGEPGCLNEAALPA